jgi:hypothetical protein
MDTEHSPYYGYTVMNRVDSSITMTSSAQVHHDNDWEALPFQLDRVTFNSRREEGTDG